MLNVEKMCVCSGGGGDCRHIKIIHYLSFYLMHTFMSKSIVATQFVEMAHVMSVVMIYDQVRSS